MIYFSWKRISPFDDELGVFADEVLVAENKQRPRVGAAEAGQTDGGCSLGDAAKRRVLAAHATQLPAAAVRGQVRHPVNTEYSNDNSKGYLFIRWGGVDRRYNGWLPLAADRIAILCTRESKYLRYYSNRLCFRSLLNRPWLDGYIEGEGEVKRYRGHSGNIVLCPYSQHQSLLAGRLEVCRLVRGSPSYN